MKACTAYTKGQMTAAMNIEKYETPENIIFSLMASNPYKNEKARRDYIDGASDFVNNREALNNRYMNKAK